MPSQDKDTLKSYFEANGRPPKQGYYEDLIDSIVPYERSGNSVSSVFSAFLNIPGLAAFYTGNMSQNSAGTPKVWDYGPNEMHLSFTGFGSNCAGGELAPFINFNDTRSAYYADASPFDISGNESYLASQLRGLTVGAWIRPNSSGEFQAWLTKCNGLNNAVNNYRLTNGSANKFVFSISNGSTSVGPTADTAFTVSNWYFVVGRFIPSTAIDILVNNIKTQYTTSVPSTMVTNNEPFVLGGESNGSGGYQSYANGYVGCSFVSQAKVPDTYLTYLYETSRWMYQ